MVYLLEVNEEKRSWPEKDQRRREWMAPQNAAVLVAEPGLADILLRVVLGQTPEWPRRLAKAACPVANRRAHTGAFVGLGATATAPVSA